MPLAPTSARGPALNYVELRPTLVFESPGKVSDQEKTEKLHHKRPSKDGFERRFEDHSERVRRGLVEKRFKEQETARNAANKKLEEGFQLNWSTTRRARERHKAEPKQLPLFAAKLHRELLESEADEFEGQPLASILSCEARQDSTEHPPTFMLGDEVEVRDKDMVEWRAGVVTCETPLEVTLDDWDHAFQWDFVRRQTSKPKEPPDQNQSLPPMPAAVQPEKHCVCGYKFLMDALFCSRCGRQRGCEILVPKSQQQPRDTPKPPRPPGGPVARKPKRSSLPVQPSVQPPSLARTGSPSPRRHSAEMTRRPSLGKSSHPVEDDARMGSGRADSPHERFRVEVYEDFHISASPMLLEEPKPRASGWQQLTVPILADNGEVVALRPAPAKQQNAWQQYTVPILGEDGQVVALRPAMGSSPMPEWKQTALPIFNEQGELVALPSGQGQWQQNTVPILGQDGEVIALRPDAKGMPWRQMAVPVFNITGEVVAVHPPIGNLKQWEQLTVPILAEDGKVLGLRPCGEHYEMPAWALPADARGSRPTASAGSSIVSDRTWLPPQSKSARSSRAVSQGGADATLRPVQSGRWAHESRSEAESVNSCNKSRMSSWPDAPSVPTVCKEEEEYVPRPSSLPQSRCSTPESSAGDAASCASFQHILRSASADSLASIDRILSMANAARQATPDGQMMQVLRDALCSETSGSSASCPSGRLQLPKAPEADELVARLRQLPELWRSTILQMLEQAEAVQQASNDFPK
eukprot:TRINITY_DN16516_c0_g3_i1.p1 TRINITY_DN16516_c0_g3~~TRINITY_DN16516_c0_g3_i1.p1  ORF type:complete len:753 (-),score=156.98 TRINITY_DN16516_c0_g3_i1:7-2265(-)